MVKLPTVSINAIANFHFADRGLSNSAVSYGTILLEMALEGMLTAQADFSLYFYYNCTPVE